jgi:ubiquitin C-terminal hydrolase
MDPYTWNIIDLPVRGTKCVHRQCFDLKTFLSFMNVQRVRQWKCPVCGKDCRNFEVDIEQI